MASAQTSAILISAPASGQGKTTVTAALARQAAREGKRVRVFKTGPDFIDPMILARAAGQPVYQLDLWMGGLAHCRNLLYQAATDADLILVEGVMGLHDGEPSSAELARRLNLPVLVVIDGSAMAQTFGALALGLKTYGAQLTLHGVIANRVAGARHAELLAASLTGPATDIPFVGALCTDRAIELPDRHLGLLQAEEIADLDARLDRAAQALGEPRPSARHRARLRRGAIVKQPILGEVQRAGAPPRRSARHRGLSPLRAAVQGTQLDRASLARPAVAVAPHRYRPRPPRHRRLEPRAPTG